MWWVIIDKWKNDINSGSKWKPIRGWPYHHFVKCCKIICGCSITHQEMLLERENMSVLIVVIE